MGCRLSLRHHSDSGVAQGSAVAHTDGLRDCATTPTPKGGWGGGGAARRCPPVERGVAHIRAGDGALSDRERSTPGAAATSRAKQQHSQGASLAKIWDRLSNPVLIVDQGETMTMMCLDWTRRGNARRATPGGGRVKVSDPWGS